MTELLQVAGASVLVLLVVFGGLAWLRTPVYRLNEENLITLFVMVLSGEASESDWEVFVHIPIRYDDHLEQVRLCCIGLTEKAAVFVDSQGRIALTPEGDLELRRLVTELSAPG